MADLRNGHIEQRVWKCDHCGASGKWARNWSTWGSLSEAEEGRQLVLCSWSCQHASDPEALWLRKYGEPPRHFRSYAGGYLAAPFKSWARKESPNAPASATEAARE